VAQVLSGVARVKLADFHGSDPDDACLLPHTCHTDKEQRDDRWAYLAPEVACKAAESEVSARDSESESSAGWVDDEAKPTTQKTRLLNSESEKGAEQVVDVPTLSKSSTCNVLTKLDLMPGDQHSLEASAGESSPSPPPSPPLAKARSVRWRDTPSSPASTQLASIDAVRDSPPLAKARSIRWGKEPLPAPTQLMQPTEAFSEPDRKTLTSSSAGQGPRSTAQGLAAVVRRLSIVPSPPDLLPAQSADIWSFGCLLAFVGTAQPPYQDAVHERATGSGVCMSTSELCALIDWARRNECSPLERLYHVMDCPKAVVVVAEQCAQPCTAPHLDPLHRNPTDSILLLGVRLRCVLEEPTARPRAVNILSRLPRSDHLENRSISRRLPGTSRHGSSKFVLPSSRKGVRNVKAAQLPPPAAKLMPAESSSPAASQRMQHV
jgi:hypothetical protein